MSILVTGGTGKTGSSLVRRLNEAGYTPIVATRSGNAQAPAKGVKFDWSDTSTFENPFITDPNIKKVYLIVNQVPDMLAQMKPFIDLAVSKGVKRFVLLTASASAFQRGAPIPGHGLVHEYIAGLEGIELCVLRPSCFFENLRQPFLVSIRDHDEIPTPSEDGKIPFISAEDIADAAFEVLTRDKVTHEELFICGPDLYTYDEVTEILSKVLGRKVVHKRVTPEEKNKFWLSLGVPETIANVLTTAEVNIAAGDEEKIVNVENKYVGKRHYADWIEENKAAWIKA